MSRKSRETRINEIHGERQRVDGVSQTSDPVHKSVVLQAISGVYTAPMHPRRYTITLSNQVQNLKNNSSLSSPQPLQTLLQFLPSLSMFRPIILQSSNVRSITKKLTSFVQWR